MVLNYEPDTGGDPPGTGPAAGSAIAVSSGAALGGLWVAAGAGGYHGVGRGCGTVGQHDAAGTKTSNPTP